MFKKTMSLVVAFVMIAAIFGGVTAKADQLSDLQALIASLQAQIAALSGGSTAPVASATFTRDLSVGATGDDVMALQLLLNTEVGAGLPGTKYFGALTKAALVKFQVANGVPGTGYMGPMTRAAIASKQVVTTTTTTTTTTTGTPATTLEGTDGSISDVNELSSYNNEEVGDGQNDVKIAGFEVVATNDGDIALRSMKISFNSTDNSGSDNLDDYIDSVSIWKGSTKIGSADVDDFNEDSSTVFSKTITLDSGVVVKADTTEKFYVTVNAVSNLDSGDITGDSWTVNVENIRFADGSGVVTTDSTAGDLPSLDVPFNFVSFSDSSDTELKISTDSASPDADIVSISETADTDDVVLLVGKMKLEGDSDVVLDELPITFTSTGAAVASTTGSVTLKIGDDEYTETMNITVGALTGTVTFDNLDLTIEAGQTVTFTVMADINDIESGTFDEGDTLLASLTASNRNLMDVENEEGDQLSDSTEKSGTATGEAQEFRTSGVAVTLVSTSVANASGSGSNDDFGTFVIKFKVTAIGDTVYVPSLVVASTTAANVNAGKTIVLVDRAGTATVGGVSVDLVNNTDTSLTSVGNYRIEEGQSETFELTTTAQLPTIGTAATYHAVLGGVAWSLTDTSPAANLYTSNLDAFKTTLGLN